MKKGFTLIELLAVIVILAIIVLIATPIVLDMINGTKESSQLRSAEFYLDAVEQAVMKRNMDNGGNFNPTSCQIQNNGNLICDEDADNILKIEVDGEVPTSGTINFENGNITSVELVIEGITIVKNEKGELVYQTTEESSESICTLAIDADSSNSITPGDEYTCEVKEGTSYTFYILSMNADESINLILDRNVYYDESTNTSGLADDSHSGLLYWNDTFDNYDGPVAAMEYLHNSTKDWNNIPNINIDYTDEGNTGSYGYGTIKTTGTTTIITKKDGTQTASFENLKARLIKYSETSAGDFVHSNLDSMTSYWTLRSSSASSADVYAVNSIYIVEEEMMLWERGVRPVITLSKSDLK